MNTRDAGMLTVYFDGECGFCQRSVAWALARDRDRRLCAVPSGSPEGVARLGPRIEGAPSRIRAWSESGGLVDGIDAIAAMCARLPGWGFAAALLRFPPLRPFAALGYAGIAAVRRRLGPPAESCEIPGRPEPGGRRD